MSDQLRKDLDTAREALKQIAYKALVENTRDGFKNEFAAKLGAIAHLAYKASDPEITPTVRKWMGLSFKRAEAQR